MARLGRRAFLWVLASSLFGGAYAFNQTFAHQVLRYRSKLPNLQKPLRVLQLSDLHFGPWIHRRHVEGWVQSANALDPHVVLITGDLIDNESRSPLSQKVKQELSEPIGYLLQALSQLQAPLGVYACWGNHDYARRRELRQLGRQLQAAGVQVLVNQGVLLRPDVYLAGVDDYWWGQPDIQKALKPQPAGTASLLMCHNPDYLSQVPASVGLTLCGHTHGGQLRLPIVGAPWTPSQFGERFLCGWYQEPVRAYVSKGLGVSGLPLRLGAPAEMALFELVPG